MWSVIDDPRGIYGDLFARCRDKSSQNAKSLPLSIIGLFVHVLIILLYFTIHDTSVSFTHFPISVLTVKSVSSGETTPF